MDSWYLAKDLIKATVRLGLDWISRLKINRKIILQEEVTDVASFIKRVKPEDFSTEVHGIDGKSYLSKSFELNISKIGKVKVVLATLDPHNPDEEIVPLVTNRVDWNDAKITNGFFIAIILIVSIEMPNSP